jgi:hypothetical protein
MGALMAERQDSGRQESLFEGLAPPRPNPWARPPDAPARAGDAGAHTSEEVRSGEVVADNRDIVGAESSRASAPDAVRADDALAIRAPRDEVAQSPADDPAATADGPRALHGETVRPPETTVGDITIARRTAGVPETSAQPGDAGTLAGPTLDDVVSRLWEGLAIGLPAACPLCHGEVVPAVGGSLSGSCTSCGMTID